VEELAVNVRQTLTDTDRFLNHVFALIYKRLRDGDTINFSGFGKFSVSHRASREGVNPRTLEKITIPELNTPKFKAGEAFKQAIHLRR